MDSEFENKPQDQSSENERTREGYNPAGGYQKSYRPVGRTQRPRINSHRAYSSDRSSSNSEGGFRPEGFGPGNRIFQCPSFDGRSFAAGVRVCNADSLLNPFFGGRFGSLRLQKGRYDRVFLRWD